MSQTLITVFEDRQTRVSLTPSQKEDILAFRHILGENRISLSYDGILLVTHFVGFISKGKTRLQILPKVYEQLGIDEESEKLDAMRVIFNLLKVSEFDKILQLPDQSSFAEQSDIMEIFITIFANKVFHAYSRQMNREYLSISENSPFVKGRINFSENLRENPIRKDLHFVNFQSFEHDNLINNVIKSVCLKLIRLTKSSSNKKDLKKALIFLDDAQEISLSKDAFDAAKFTRLNMPFKPVFDMAKMFFYNLTPQSYQGDDTICSFLIPLNELFEYYLFKLFNSFEEGTAASYQNTHLFAREDDGLFKKVTIRPDIIIQKEKRILLIVDAKYKNPKFQNGSYTNVNQPDMYQVFAYAKVYGINSVALIYPQFELYPPPPAHIQLGDESSLVSLTVGCIDIKSSDIETNVAHLKNMLLIRQP